MFLNAIEEGFDGHAGFVELSFNEWTEGAEGVKAFAACPLAIGLLDVTGGDIVDADVAANVGADVFVGTDLVAATADDDSQFAFVINTLRDGGHADGAPGTEERRWRFEEEERLGWDFVAEFCGVVASSTPIGTMPRRIRSRPMRPWRRSS